ncbi:MAG: cytochrome P450, partial [Candidatus Dormibacteria bacterium]
MTEDRVNPAATFHFADAALMLDPYQTYGALRDQCPVGRSDLAGGFWVLSRYEDVLRAAADTDTFSSAEGVMFPAVPGLRSLIPFEVDSPLHE